MADSDYQLIDSGSGEKLEQFGKYRLIRPCSQAIWPRDKDKADAWREAHASFNRRNGFHWHGRHKLPENWVIQANSVKMKLATTNFGHIGIFPETLALWNALQSKIRPAKSEDTRNQKEPFHFLNLFAYSGGATLAAAQAGANCCHVDASKGMVQWAKENAQINQLEEHPIRWIVDDVNKFLTREIRRGRRYHGILLDPPSFGRGKSGELYKIEHAMIETLDKVHRVLSPDYRFIYLTSHTPGFTPTVLSNLLKKIEKNGNISSGEMLLKGKDPNTLSIPNGAWACIDR